MAENRNFYVDCAKDSRVDEEIGMELRKNLVIIMQIKISEKFCIH